MTPNDATMIAALALALAAAITDLRSRRIPNALVLAGAASGLLLNVLAGGASGAGRALIGAAVGFVIFLPFYLLGGMGGGDVKLMGALGACVGPLQILQAAFAASMVGAALALVAAAWNGVLIRTLARTGRLLFSWLTRGPRPSRELSLDNPAALKIPYAVPIAAAAILLVISGA